MFDQMLEASISGRRKDVAPLNEIKAAGRLLLLLHQHEDDDAPGCDREGESQALSYTFDSSAGRVAEASA